MKIHTLAVIPLLAMALSANAQPALIATPVGVLYAASMAPQDAPPAAQQISPVTPSLPPSECLQADTAAARSGFEMLHGERAKGTLSGHTVDANGFIEVVAGDAVCPLSARDKFVHFARNAISPLTFLGAAGAAGISQATNSDPAFGQGGRAYLRRFGAAVADSESRRFFADFVFPAVFHEDPRYFRKAQGGGGVRMGYALTRVLVTRRDSGARSFNFSEVLGTLASAGLSNAYLRERERTGAKTMQRAAVSFGVDAGFNLLREFLPDIFRKLHGGK